MIDKKNQTHNRPPPPRPVQCQPIPRDCASGFLINKQKPVRPSQTIPQTRDMERLYTPLQYIAVILFAPLVVILIGFAVIMVKAFHRYMIQ